MNKIHILGNLGEDPKLKTLGKGNDTTTVCNVSIATDNGRFGSQQRDVWFQAAIWGKRAEAFAKHLKKGDQVALSGSVEMETWNDEEGDLAGSKMVLHVDDFHFTYGSRDGSSKSPDQGKKSKAKSQSVEDDDDDFDFD